MIAVIGIDESFSSRHTLDLFFKMKFEGAEAVFVYAIESVFPDGSFVDFPEDHPLGELMRESAAAGRKILKHAQELATAHGIRSRTEVVQGAPAKVLQEIAEREQADLVVLGCNRRPALDDLLLGSTARTLLHECTRSLLIGRHPVASPRSLKLILAVDSRRDEEVCAQVLLNLMPKGFGEIDVVTVNPLGLDDIERLDDLPFCAEELSTLVQERIETKGARVASRLGALGARTKSVVLNGEVPACAIAIAADQAHADVIAVYSEPHGFIDRHLKRSVSEGLFANDRRALLVLRPQLERN